MNGVALKTPKRKTPNKPRLTKTPISITTDMADERSSSMKVDTGLLDRARMQWQFGDWESLAQLDLASISNDVNRAHLAVLVAGAHQQLDNRASLLNFLRLSKQWGCRKRAISAILVAGVHNTLGRVCALNTENRRALEHFEASVQGVSGDARLASQARSVREVTRLGLLREAATMIGKEVKELADANQRLDTSNAPKLDMLQSELSLLQHELSLAQKRGQLKLPEASGKSLPGTEDSIDNIRSRSTSQLGQDLWVLERLGYKRNGFFVEFGATDGISLSNTWLLESAYSWHGICAEPNPKLYDRLKISRACICSSACVAGVDGEEREFILADAFGTLREYQDADMHLKRRTAYSDAGHVTTVTTTTLDTLLTESRAPRDIDYISIDTEGSELEIVSTIDFDKWRVKLLTIEHNFQEGPRQKIRHILKEYGYQVQEAEWDDWFWREDLL